MFLSRPYRCMTRLGVGGDVRNPSIENLSKSKSCGASPLGIAPHRTAQRRKKKRMYLLPRIHACGFISWGYRGEYVSSSTHGESLREFIVVDGGIRTHDPKTHDLSTTPFVKELVGF